MTLECSKRRVSRKRTNKGRIDTSADMLQHVVKMKIIHFMATYVCFAITFVHVYVNAHLECVTCRSFYARKTHDSKVIITIVIHLDVNNVSHTFIHASTATPMYVKVDIYIDRILSSKTSPQTCCLCPRFDTCRGEDDIRNHILQSRRTASKTTPKTTISQNLISRTNMLFRITFSSPTRRQQNQQLQLQFQNMQCQCHFFMGSNCHPKSATNST